MKMPWRRLSKPWRSVLVELAVVVAGILIALGLGQAVEDLRDRSEAAEARDAIHAEVVANITRVNQRSLGQACVDRRLDELRAILDGAIADGRIDRPSWIGKPSRYAIESTRWVAASQSGRVSLLPAEQQARLGFIYVTLGYFYEMENGEQLAWARLRALEGVDRLTPDGMLAMRGALEEAEFYNWSIRQVTPIVMARARTAGLKPTKRTDSQPTVCWPTDLPHDEGARRERANDAAAAARQSVSPAR